MNMEDTSFESTRTAGESTESPSENEGERKSKHGLGEEVGRLAKRVSGEIREESEKRAKDFLYNQKEHLADELHSSAEVFRESSRHFEENKQLTTSRYANEIAEQVDRYSRFLKERDLDGLAKEITGIARNKPIYFLISAFGAGFLLSRFFKSSEAYTEAPGSNPYSRTFREEGI